MFCKNRTSMKVLKKWPECKNVEVNAQFDIQFQKLQRLRILLKDEKGEYVWINPIFAENLLEILTSDHELTLVKEKTSVDKKKQTQAEMNKIAKSRLTKIYYFMLELIGPGDVNPFILSLLKEARLIDEINGSYILTVDGFNFMLEDICTQIHILLLNYIKMSVCILKKGKEFPEIQKKRMSNPQHLQLIFQLILSNQKSYKINETKSEVNRDDVQDILIELKQLGLISMYKKNRFYVTQLMRFFLLGEENADFSRSLLTEDTDKSIIVETNFKVY